MKLAIFVAINVILLLLSPWLFVGFWAGMVYIGIMALWHHRNEAEIL